jgi:WD40 repeat protein
MTKSISWGMPGIWADLVAVRSENKGISLLDLTPTHVTDIELPSKEGHGSSVSWTPDGDYLAHVAGDDVYIVDSRCGFTLCAQMQIPGSSLQSIAFSPKTDTYKLAGVGLDGKVYVFEFSPPSRFTIVKSVVLEENLWALAWSRGKTATTNLFPTMPVN